MTAQHDMMSNFNAVKTYFTNYAHQRAFQNPPLPRGMYLPSVRVAVARDAAVDVELTGVAVQADATRPTAVHPHRRQTRRVFGDSS